MIDCRCFIQEGQSPDQNKAAIAGELNAFSTAAFGSGTDPLWIPIAKGNGFTASKPSTSSVVSITANKPLDNDRREQLLRQLVALWTAATGCSEDEIVAVIADPLPA